MDCPKLYQNLSKKVTELRIVDRRKTGIIRIVCQRTRVRTISKDLCKREREKKNYLTLKRLTNSRRKENYYLSQKLNKERGT